MKLFVGLDVSPEKTAICVISEHGKIVKEAQAASEAKALTRWIGQLDGTIAAIGLEAGPMSQWSHSVQIGSASEVPISRPRTSRLPSVFTPMAMMTATESKPLLRHWSERQWRPAHRAGP